MGSYPPPPSPCPFPVGEPLTDVVPASASGGASPPGAVKLGQSPLGDGVVTQGVRCQVADLQSRVLAQEVREGHPAGGATCPTDVAQQKRQTSKW